MCLFAGPTLDPHAGTSAAAAGAGAAAWAGDTPAVDIKRRLTCRLHPSDLLGFPSQKQKRAYQLWKAGCLQAQDVWLFAFNVLRVTMVVAIMARFAWSEPHPASKQLLYASVLYMAMVLAPMLLYCFARQAYLRGRGAVWSACVLTKSVHGALVMTNAFGTPDLWEEWGQACLPRTIISVLLLLLQPTLTRLTVGQQAVVAIGQALITGIMFAISGRALSMSTAACVFLPLAVLSVLLAGALDWSMRRKWLLNGGTGQRSQGAAATAAQHGGGRLKGE